MASDSEPTVPTAGQAFVARLLDHLASKSYQMYAAMVWEGRIFSQLEEQGVPFVRALESAICDGALLCEPTDATGAERTIQTIEDDHDVVPLDIKIVRTRILYNGRWTARGLTTKNLTGNRPLQRERVQLFIVYLPNSQEFLFVPKKFSDLHLWAGRWEESGSVEIPPRFLPCVVRFEDIAQACEAVRACAVDKSLPFVNPSTQVEFPAGLFDTFPASMAISKNNLSTSDEQIFFIQRAVSEQADLHFDFHAIPLIVYDFTIDIPACGEVRFEAKINCFSIIGKTELKHALARPRKCGGFNSLFRRNMTMQYLFTQSGFDFAYVIPVGEIPDSWYAAPDPEEPSSLVGSILLTSIDRFRIDLKSGTWVEDMVCIVQRTWPPTPREVTGQDISLLAQHVADGQQLADVDMADSDDEGPESVSEELLKGRKLPLHLGPEYLLSPGMFTTQLASAFDSEGRQYQQLMKACASVGRGVIVPYERPRSAFLEHSSDRGRERFLSSTYCYVPYQWTPDEIRDFWTRRTVPLKATNIAPTTRVLPLALVRHMRTHGMSITNITLRILAHPRREVVLLYPSASSSVTDRATVEGAEEDQLLLIPSEFIGIERNKLGALKRAGPDKRRTPLSELLTHSSMNFRCPFKEVANALNSFFDGAYGGMPDFFVREERLAVRKVEYICFWKSLQQSQVDELFSYGKENAGDADEDDEEDEDVEE